MFTMVVPGVTSKIGYINKNNDISHKAPCLAGDLNI